jgi:glycosyltransferase involved in cell wall biosynthesis
MHRTILLINHYAGSAAHGMEFRPYYMARHWRQLGLRVFVVAGSYSHVRRRNPEVHGSYRVESIGGIAYLWIRTPAYKKSGLRRVLNILCFVVRLRVIAARLSRLRELAAVIASSTYPFDIFPGRFVARKGKAKLIFELHDLWPLSPQELGHYSRFHPFILLTQVAENRAYRVADRVVSILPNTLDHMVRHGLAAHKFIHIPNGVEPTEPAPIDESTAAALCSLPKGAFVVGYMGSVGPANAIGSLLEAAACLRAENGLAIVIVGSGELWEEVQGAVKTRQLSNVSLIPAVAKSQVQYFLDRFDVCYLGVRKSSLYRYGMSLNKLFDYMYAARPILQAVEASNDLVSEVGCGLTVEPENPRAIAEAIRELLHLDKSELRKMGDRGRAYVLQHHTYERLASRFAKLFG